MEKLTPRKHQIKAIADIVNGFKSADRGKFISACGTGKTLTSLWVAEGVDAELCLVVVPSLALVSAILTTWKEQTSSGFDYLVVCSDATVDHRHQDGSENVVSDHELGDRVTSEKEEISSFLLLKSSRRKYVFATYQSLRHVSEAQQYCSVYFDLAVIDEAHHCVGEANSPFTLVLDGKKILSRKRLFATATPRYYGSSAKLRAETSGYELHSMDDEKVFGKVFHYLSFGQAIEKKLLCDYRVVVIGVTDADRKEFLSSGAIRVDGVIHTDPEMLTVQIGLAKAMMTYDLKKMITFHQTVRRAKSFSSNKEGMSFPEVTEAMSAIGSFSGKVESAWLDGKMRSSRKIETLKWLSEAPKDVRRVVSNCRCLSEGIDVSSLDSIAYVDPKNSIVEIIQSIGRAVRKSDEKTVGTIIIPVMIHEKESVEDTLQGSSFKTVWNVLQALRAHDVDFGNVVDSLKGAGQRERRERLRKDDKILFHGISDISIEKLEEGFYTRIVDNVSEVLPKSSLTEQYILDLGRVHFKTHGVWPNPKAGGPAGDSGENWTALNAALRAGYRGLPGGSSLRKLFEEKKVLWTEEKVRGWAEAYFSENGAWPNVNSGQVSESPKHTWKAVSAALWTGAYGLPGGSSLRRFLNSGINKDDLSIEEVKKWVSDYIKENGIAPTSNCGSIIGTKETWRTVYSAFERKNRGIPHSASWTEIVGRKWAQISIEKVKKWAQTYFDLNGKWPSSKSGRDGIDDDSGETWMSIISSLRSGCRGVRKKMSCIKELMTDEVPPGRPGKLSMELIKTWADAFFAKNGYYPLTRSGPVDEAPGETWRNIEAAMRKGNRGLPKGSLTEFLRGKKYDLTIQQIKEWILIYEARFGKFPVVNNSVPLPEMKNDTWIILSRSLIMGNRGLPAGSISIPKICKQIESERARNEHTTVYVADIVPKDKAGVPAERSRESQESH